ncbi:hypothetical protein PHYBLDRAFT_72701 [Phycomyces blakesleeanus NRRL 1555(-)]|uniref:Uncharacterized protein n=1 Tax=Phycomyces blakesleeanus (strain ATCC 8743b / DSM 1359 / FGSC 10004 / NBRC 33097 / NRRL 1555) TaxID=763407 RepID=A0A167M548_PHYB8|nr:hypothetical protein PHYBLDRAFT_72701 [Phycomyces blakesleeanus NRRL 1555(-)]OAD71829.1 hypothetical protein PHYBLDRAFT_72701 [Phycomyces blakesleeanus NRRL 1555(-)]|eukprot:XP_018289869.1 hypothetical protein PHYBLDRAFT_72701 [Phycomyces blakesleeanus NRRL 1555(-)]
MSCSNRLVWRRVCDLVDEAPDNEKACILRRYVNREEKFGNTVDNDTRKAKSFQSSLEILRMYTIVRFCLVKQQTNGVNGGELCLFHSYAAHKPIIASDLEAGVLRKFSKRAKALISVLINEIGFQFFKVERSAFIGSRDKQVELQDGGNIPCKRARL